MKTLVDIVREHRLRVRTAAGQVPRIACACEWCGPATGEGTHAHDVHVAAAYQEARTVRTVEERDALPEGTIILDSLDALAAPQVKMQFDEDGPAYWIAGESDWSPALPALVIYLPGDVV